ncbi:hypothetical protein JOD82_001843 [Paenibacillus sp. 1182]|uniref:hypothetical protein n=1 Tax=Paenibacillus sp. 1182 TaxID=2806565 RepID=UPI001B7A1680|nr:hypothetical protein [Paenibacillus sp. 1182]MBP1308823.1 hypothetical protein [Paenibacillus sp. 1182]
MQALSDILDTTGLFYYMTMKDYERSERKQRKYKPQLVRRVFPTEKARLVQNGSALYTCLFDFKVLRRYVDKTLRIESYEELFRFLSQLPFHECMNPAITLDTYFPCKYIFGNYAWITQDSNGHYRYFSKKKSGDVVSFDLLDLIEIAYGIPTMEAVEKATEIFSIRFMEEVWKKEQKEKYIRNYQFIQSEIQDENQYPMLYRYLREFAPLLEALNALATLHIHKKEYSYKNHNSFFASSSHITNVMGMYTSSKIAKLLNVFAVLGLIEKVPTSELHPLFLKESLKISEQRCLGNTVSFYIVHSFEQVAEEAERRAALLNQNGIRYSNISKTVLSKVFGLEFAESIYVQTIQKNKKKQAKRLEVVQHQLEINFLEKARRASVVTKSNVLEQEVGELTEKQKKHHLNQIWTYLMEKYHCEYIKPTSQMKKEFALSTSEYIAIPKDRSLL